MFQSRNDFDSYSVRHAKMCGVNCKEWRPTISVYVGLFHIVPCSRVGVTVISCTVSPQNMSYFQNGQNANET